MVWIGLVLEVPAAGGKYAPSADDGWHARPNGDAAAAAAAATGHLLKIILQYVICRILAMTPCSHPLFSVGLREAKEEGVASRRKLNPMGG